MTENERIRELRKSLDMTLEKFGEKVGVTRASMSNVENGNRGVTEQMRKAVCREFGVDYIWLTTGEGEMFVDTDDDLTEKIDRIMAGENLARKNMIITAVTANDEYIEALDQLVTLYWQAKNKKD